MMMLSSTYSFKVALVSVYAPTDYTTPPPIFSFFSKFMSSYTMSLFRIFSGCASASKVIKALFNEADMVRITAPFIIANNVVENIHPVIFNKPTIGSGVKQSVYFLGSTSIINDSVSLTYSSSPVPALRNRVFLNLSCDSLSFIISKFNNPHINILPKQGVICNTI